jgi:hypothetical protein
MVHSASCTPASCAVIGTPRDPLENLTTVEFVLELSPLARTR